jgi:hypothetical protein
LGLTIKSWAATPQTGNAYEKTQRSDFRRRAYGATWKVTRGRKFQLKGHFLLFSRHSTRSPRRA